jgi:hypothetical protein
VSAGELAGRAAVGLEQERLRSAREARAVEIFMQVSFEIVMTRHAALLVQAHQSRHDHVSLQDVFGRMVTGGVGSHYLVDEVKSIELLT